MADGVAFGMLGPLLVRVNGEVVPIPRGKQRTLLAVLLLRAGRIVPADQLADLLWSPLPPPPSAAVTLQNYVKRLRQALGPAGRERIVTQPGGYLIQVEPGELDLTVMEQTLAHAQRATRDNAWAQVADGTEAALRLWRGEPLSDLDVPDVAAVEMARLSELRLQAQELQAEANLHLGRHAESVTGLEQLAAAYPLREHLHALLMLALYRSGRRGEALEAYRRARNLLIKELGSDPGPELQDLHQQILRDDPALTPAWAGQPGPVPAAAPDPIRQLPAAVSSFTGREAELAALTSLIGPEPGARTPPLVISAIGGTAGVGKTALAVHWAHEVAERFPDGQLYVNLRGYDPGRPVTPDEALAGFLAALGVPGPKIPAEADDRAAMYRSMLAGRRLLVVLDNARDVGQVRPLLPGEPSCLVVVTSRDMLAGLVARDGARRVALDVLSVADAVALLRVLIGSRVDTDPGAAAHLAELCGRLPLALRVAAEMAVAAPGRALAEVAAELEGQSRLDVLAAGGDQATAVRAVFSSSYSGLSAEAARTFRMAGLHPGTDFDASAVAALTGTSASFARQALAELERASLIQQAAGGRYSMHDLLRAYGAELAAAHEPETDRREARTRLLDHYLQMARRAGDILFTADAPKAADASGDATGAVINDATGARVWLDAEQANLVAVAAYASEHDWPGHAAGLSAALFPYLDSGGLFDQALAIHGAAVRAAVRAGDRAAELGAVHNIGTVYTMLARYPAAERHFKRALGLSRKLGDRLGEIRALLNLGLIYRCVGAYPEATSRCLQALELSRTARDRIREGRALMYLGLIAIRHGRYRQANTWLIEAIDASRHGDDRICLTFALASLGEVEVRQGRYREARSHLEQARTIARQIGYTMGEAAVVANLGVADLQEGRHRQAAQQLQQAVAAFHEAGVSAVEAELLCYLGLLDLRLGRPAAAADHYQHALSIYQPITEPFGEADARNGLGEAAFALGALGDASAHHKAALAIAHKISSPEPQARAHEGLGSISAATNDIACAHQHWQEALALYAEMDVPEIERVRAKLIASAHCQET